ncbi:MULTISPECIES: sarcosine oxidase subunit gamma [Streptomyces]|uniref:Putative sarcosine oxidase gamma subunit n=1 Tax=Streptomyces scabiei (strain 87.22) TaxID=680198 RepID=C9YXA3_STRSW|nr:MULTISPECIES: sarcosine oxidase subunit gamma family protein [Streptomyces]MBP5859557.1 sarcosine oxidase subunit gamma [Streptomyces sp. LBUM 1484]MBP5871758.1 sarcosine oxidase subunit gamma [Streptomyces sp. LBUM 1485]MBP5926903.1 sarcosine oxidase subunit gamma [Streptomyces sp. LBUM 1479]KFG10169.1 sarcosine oxidase subunit gamma [Streptomyces scabiei]MBP5880244.1 sarcosine oxidase subunit gamma [Streptomyces sp. LBUM 1477]
MADTALTARPRSPLSGAADRLAAATRASGGAIRLAELPFLTQLDVRLDPKGAAADAVGLALGLPLPLEPDTVVRAGELTALWLGPDEWLLVGPPGGARELENRIREAAGEEHISVTDVSAQRTTVLVAGAGARDLLAHGCSLDLHPRAFGPGRCAQTTLGRTQVVLVAREEPGAGFWVLVRSSFAGYLADWLLDAATEYV